MPVQYFVNPGQQCVTETQPPLKPRSECVFSFLADTGCCTAPHCLARYSHTQKPHVTLTFDLDIQ